MIGKTVSHYRVIEKLGGGGMGVVYKAEDTRLNRRVALKFLQPGIADSEDIRLRFIQEAKAASSLDHANIGVIYEIDEADDGQMFIAQAFYDGETLKKKIQRGPLELEQAVDIAIQVAQGLVRAHQGNIVHRDIKPANIMITKDGVAKIIDFGLAKLGDATKLTRVGTTLGTLAYMSPEQVKGEEADGRSDIWALGILLYEMLTGERPFEGNNEAAILHSVLNDNPKSASDINAKVPRELEIIVAGAIQKDVNKRYSNAAEMLSDLSRHQAVSTGTITVKTEAEPVTQALRRPAVALPVLLILAAAGAAVFWSMRQSSRERYAREELLPEIRQLVMDQRYDQAFDLALQAEQIVPDDPILAELWSDVAIETTITTEPPGASVSMREYSDLAGEWRSLGTTPLENIRVPRGTFRWRIETDGHDSLLIAGPSEVIGQQALQLHAVGSIPADSVFVPGGLSLVSLTGFAPTIDKRITLSAYLIDKYEVTNEEYKQFIEAGGYRNQQYWKHDFVRDRQELSFDEAMAAFVDSTGRPGPSTWELGNYPQGQADHPVSGVSWYEAVAYAEFVGKSLPTLYHWSKAAFMPIEAIQPFSPHLIKLSNFEGDGTVAVGSLHGISPYGSHDMGGNVKEWCWNASDDHRYVLGGAWDDATYFLSLPYIQPPFDRPANTGFRCARYTTGIPEEKYLDPIRLMVADRANLVPVSDEVYEVFTDMLAYTKAPLNAEVDSIDDSHEYWTYETVTLDVGYENDRLVLKIYLPKDEEGPCETVVYFPGLNAFDRPRNTDDDDLFISQYFDFIMKSGRAFVYPTYEGSFDRYDGFALLPAGGPLERATSEHFSRWVYDLGTTIDYLEERDDLDAEKIAYLGWSYGASIASPLLALERRIKTAVLISGGYVFLEMSREMEALNHNPRITLPVLMINGNADYLFPLETAQVPFFEALGTPPEHKRHVVYETGHWPMPRKPMMNEILDWFDTYLTDSQ